MMTQKKSAIYKLTLPRGLCKETEIPTPRNIITYHVF